MSNSNNNIFENARTGLVDPEKLEARMETAIRRLKRLKEVSNARQS